MVDPSNFAPFDFASSYAKGAAIRRDSERQWDNQRRVSLGDLYTKDPQGAIEEAIQAGDLELAKQFYSLSAEQKKQAQSELDDVVGAVRWADTPEKWAQVQQYYGAHGHDVSGYTFENRESYLLSLGKMGEYLKGAGGGEQPSSVREYEYAKRQGYTGSYMDYQAQNGSPIMVDNGDGTKTLYPRSVLSGGGQPQGQPAPPPPGFVIDGGPAAPQPGGFRGPF